MREDAQLSPAEKQAGRAFLAEQQAKLVASFDTDPPTYKVLPWHRIYRHECPARSNVSTALELQERYVLSPAYGEVPAARFGFIYKEGRCRGCKGTARSKTGRLVDAYQRPPLDGRVAR